MTLSLVFDLLLSLLLLFTSDLLFSFFEKSDFTELLFGHFPFILFFLVPHLLALAFDGLFSLPNLSLSLFLLDPLFLFDLPLSLFVLVECLTSVGLLFFTRTVLPVLVLLTRFKLFLLQALLGKCQTCRLTGLKVFQERQTLVGFQSFMGQNGF
jgi:hypothetical protein